MEATEVVPMILPEALVLELEKCVVLPPKEVCTDELLTVELGATLEADTEEESREVDELEELGVLVVVGTEERSVMGVEGEELPIETACSGMV